MVTPQSQNVHKLPQNGLVSSHQSVGKWLLVYVFCSKNILSKLIGYQQPTVSIWNRWMEVEPFRFYVNCIHFRGAVFVHVGSAQLCKKNGVSFYMCSAVEVTWLAQNNRHSCTRV